jgi:hypothetical protein
VPPRQSNVQSSTRLARLEPAAGSYIGAFIDRDDELGESFFDENHQTHHSSRDWAQLVGKPHSSYFMYLRYGQRFPHAWVQHLKENGAIPHIAWEPTSLAQVKDDAYLRDFAREAARANWPIFFRFASEMNGFWTPYHGNPALYRQKFRLVHQTLHKYAPLAATIWCVGNPPLGNVMQYYPGDDGCDWVGVNFYSVPFVENDRRRPAFDHNPLSLLEPVYRMFAARKPIAICEYAASHQAGVDRVSRPEFAESKLLTLYGSLPRLYPRVKLVNWFSMNSIRYSVPGKTLSNYSLGENSRVLAAYRRVVAEPYFLSRWGETPYSVPRAVTSGQTVRGRGVWSIWAKPTRHVPKCISTGRQNRLCLQCSRAHIVALDLARSLLDVKQSKCRLRRQKPTGAHAQHGCRRRARMKPLLFVLARPPVEKLGSLWN